MGILYNITPEQQEMMHGKMEEISRLLEKEGGSPITPTDFALLLHFLQFLITSRTDFEEWVVQVLVRWGFVTEEQSELALESYSRVGEYTTILSKLVILGIKIDESLVRALNLELGVPVVDIRQVQIKPEALRLVPKDLADKHGILPIEVEPDGTLFVVAEEPIGSETFLELHWVTGRLVRFGLALGGYGELDRLIKESYAPLQRLPRPQPRRGSHK